MRKNAFGAFFSLLMVCLSFATFFSTFFSALALAEEFYWTGDIDYSDGVFESDGTATLLFGSYRNHYGCFLPDVPTFDMDEVKVYVNQHSASGYTKVYMCPTNRRQFNSFDCSPSGSEMEDIINRRYCKSPLVYLGELSVGGFKSGWNTLRFSPYRLYAGDYILWFYSYNMRGNDISNVDGSSDKFYFYRSAYACTDSYAVIKSICNIKLGGAEIERGKSIRSLSDIRASTGTNLDNAASTTASQPKSESSLVVMWAAIITVSFVAFLIALWLKIKGKRKIE